MLEIRLDTRSAEVLGELELNYCISVTSHGFWESVEHFGLNMSRCN
jgi:hypothetical protein